MNNEFVGIVEFVDMVSAKTGLQKQQTRATIDAVIETIYEILRDGKRLQIQGLGVFKVVVWKSRTGRDVVNNVEAVKIPERKHVVFKPGKSLKEFVEGM